MDPRSSEDDFRVVVGRVGQDGTFKVRLRGVLDATAEAELAQVLARASVAHEDVGLFEFASAYDKALQAFCRRMGLDPLAVMMVEMGEETQAQPEAADA